MNKLKDKIKNFKIDKNLPSKDKFEKSKKNLKELAKLIGITFLVIVFFNITLFGVYGTVNFLINLISKIWPCNLSQGSCVSEALIIGLPIQLILFFILIAVFIVLEISVLLSIVISIILVIILIVYAFIVLHYSEQVRIEKKKSNNN